MTDEAAIYCARCGIDLSDADFWQLSARRTGIDLLAPVAPPLTELCDPCKVDFDRFLDPAGVVR